MYCYAAYDLRIHSRVPLPELIAAAGGTPDVTIRYAEIERPPDQEGENTFLYAPGEALLCWKNVGTFLVRGGGEIYVQPAPEVDEETLRLFLLGAVMAALLHQRGLLVLHASAVCVDGGVVAFVGEKGWGKSTAAAALHARGHSLVTDDLLAVEVDPSGTSLVLPGFPQLKLFPSAAAATLGDDPQQLAPVNSGTEKRLRPVGAAFTSRRLPLRAVYILGREGELGVEPLPPREAVIQLVRHTFVAHLVGATGRAGAHLNQCGAVARQARVCRLTRPLDLTALPALARRIEEAGRGDQASFSSPNEVNQGRGTLAGSRLAPADRS